MKKEHYRHILPHYQLPGQAYFVTWCLKDAIPPKALKRYTQKLEELKNQREYHKTNNSNKKIQDKIAQEYYVIRRKYIKSFDDLLHVTKTGEVDLSKPANMAIVKESLNFWQGKKLENRAFCIMPNHVHWVFQLHEKDETGTLVYLQDIMQSIKRFSAYEINQLEKREGRLWQKESFDTTIRNEKHLFNAIEYTLNNPVTAGLVKNRKNGRAHGESSGVEVSNLLHKLWFGNHVPGAEVSNFRWSLDLTRWKFPTSGDNRGWKPRHPAHQFIQYRSVLKIRFPQYTNGVSAAATINFRK